MWGLVSPSNVVRNLFCVMLGHALLHARQQRSCPRLVKETNYGGEIIMGVRILVTPLDIFRAEPERGPLTPPGPPLESGLVVRERDSTVSSAFVREGQGSGGTANGAAAATVPVGQGPRSSTGRLGSRTQRRTAAPADADAAKSPQKRPGSARVPLDRLERRGASTRPPPPPPPPP